MDLTPAVPTVLPLGFLMLNTAAKRLVGQKQFPFMGADTALCGCAVLTGVFLRQFLAGLNSYLGVSTVVKFVIAYGIWMLCIKLGGFSARLSKKLPGVTATFFGLIAFGLSAEWAWSMLSTIGCH